SSRPNAGSQQPCTLETLLSTPCPVTSISVSGLLSNRCSTPRRLLVRGGLTFSPTICCTQWPTCACPPTTTDPATLSAWSTCSSTGCATVPGTTPGKSACGRRRGLVQEGCNLRVGGLRKIVVELPDRVERHRSGHADELVC